MSTSKDTNFILTHLGELEALAEEILTEKQQIVDLDRKRNQSREATRALKKQADSPLPPRQNPKKETKAWICFGNTFVKLPAKNVQAMLTEDQKKLDDEIAGLRNGLKPKVAKLRDMEGKAEKKGFNLVALSQDEMKAVSHPGIR